MAAPTAPLARAVPAWMRPFYLLAGLLSVGVGIVGIFLPLIPTTGPLLLAAFFFARSSERLHTWLVTHPRFGRFVADFENGRIIPLRAKLIALVAMTAAFTYAAGWVVTHPAARIGVAAVGLWALWFVARLPTTVPSPEAGAESDE